MTTWLYIGCEITKLSADIEKNSKDMTVEEIKGVLGSIPLIEGKLEAYNVDAVTALLLDDGIFPLKIHPLNIRERNAEKLKKVKKNIKK